MQRKTAIKGAFVAVAITVAAAAPALATSVDVGGGKWSYDHGANTAWSNYKHPKNFHASSVKIGTVVFGSGCTDPGIWSLASANLQAGKSTGYYYNPQC